MEEEPFLLLHHFGGDFQDRLGALVQRLDQPVGIGQLVRQPAARSLVVARSAQFEVIGAVDDQPGQGRLVQPDVPAAIAARADQNVGRDRIPAAAGKAQARLGVIAAQFSQHVGEVFVVHPAHPLQPRQFAARQQVQVVEQLGHAGVIAVRLARLQGQAFAQIARPDSGGVERLYQGQRLLHLVLAHAQFVCQFAGGSHQVAGLVQFTGDVVGDEGQFGIAGGRANLGVQMVGQRFRAFAAIFDSRSALARCGAGIGAPVPGVAVAVQGGRINVQRAVVVGPPFGNQLVGGGAFQAGAAQFAGLQFDRFRRGAAAAQIEQGIGFQRLANEAFDFQIGQRQQLDRLLELGSHHQRLALPKIKARPKSHGRAA